MLKRLRKSEFVIEKSMKINKKTPEKLHVTNHTIAAHKSKLICFEELALSFTVELF